MGASTIGNDISTIDSRWFDIKNRNGGDEGVRISTIENSCSTIGAQLNQSDSTLKFGMGGGNWGDIPTNNALNVATIPSNNISFVGTVPSNTVLYVGTAPSNNHKKKTR